jgi:cell division transport system permease protein
LIDDIDTELVDMEYDPTDPPIELVIDDQTLDELRQVFSALRVGGTIVLALLFVIIFFFTLMTVEFRTYNRMEEIGVMQLVGGSLFYIRAPYILEGGFYGVLGALISSLILGAVGIGIFVLNPTSALAIFIHERISILPLPMITLWGWILVILVQVLLGFLLGGISSFLAIRRYIK